MTRIFWPSLRRDVLVFSSLNSTESFGIVQIEAPAGTPILASDLPGVRQPVLRTGMGKIVPIRDSKALAMAVIEVLKDFERKEKTRRDIPQDYLARFSQEEVSDGMKRNLKGLSMTNKLSSEDLDKIVENQCFHLPYFGRCCVLWNKVFIHAKDCLNRFWILGRVMGILPGRCLMNKNTLGLTHGLNQV